MLLTASNSNQADEETVHHSSFFHNCSRASQNLTKQYQILWCKLPKYVSRFRRSAPRCARALSMFGRDDAVGRGGANVTLS
jgi:hypothetical protein